MKDQLNNCTNEKIRTLIETHQKFLIVSHIRPDGDAVGSILGLGLSISEKGKQVQMVLENGVPGTFKHLSGSDKIVEQPTLDADLVITVDCSELSRAGKLSQNLSPDINIDHHITNSMFAECNFVFPEAVATSAIIAKEIEGWGLSITQPVASALLTGIVTDTLGYRTANMDADTLRLSAMLMEKGANLSRLYNLGFVQRSFEATKYWGQGLIKLQHEDKLVWTALTLEDRVRANYNRNDDADLINILSSISDHEISIILVEQSDGTVKVSWRAQPGWDISKIALYFGGGGHPAAAGAEINGQINEVEEKVLQKTLSLLNGNKVK